MRSFFFLQRLNVRTFFALLQVLLPELERSVSDDTQDKGSALGSKSVKITAVTRRVLPALRQYSSWLLSNAEILLAAQVGDNVLSVQIRELWKIYATTLTLLTSTFIDFKPPHVEYLLDEDEDTVGFKPLDNERTKQRYYDEIDLVLRKPKYHDRGLQRHHPNMEMLGRIRDLLTDGMNHHSDEVGFSCDMSAEEAYWIIESPNQACGCGGLRDIHLHRRRHAGRGKLPSAFIIGGYRAR